MESAWSTRNKAGVQNKALIFQAAYNITNITHSFQWEKKKRSNLIVNAETVFHLQSFRELLTLECDAFVYIKLLLSEVH